MSISNSTIHEVASTGSDGNAGSDSNAGAFEPEANKANFISDLATDTATANTSSPVISSATYNFVAGDVNSWLFVSSGTHWQAGWYKIASVASNKATLDAAIGHAVLYSIGGPYAVNTSAGCTSDNTSTLSSGTGTMDYSQVGTPVVSATDLASTNATSGSPSVTSASRTFTKNDIGNHLSITAGTNWTTGIFRITNVSAGAATLDRACGSAASVSSGTFREGGCLASPGQASANHTGGNHIYVKGNATYSVTSASTNTAAGCVSLLTTPNTSNYTAIYGYNAYRPDRPQGSARPIFQASGISTFTLVTATAAGIFCIILDCNSLTSGQAVASSGSSACYRAWFVTAKNCKNSAFNGTGTHWFCDATGCSTASVFKQSGNARYRYCVAWSNTISAFDITGTAGSGCSLTNCLAVNNTGASSFGIVVSGNNMGLGVQNCIIYNSGSDGVRVTGGAGQEITFVNIVSYGNGGWGYNATAQTDVMYFQSCAAGNNGSGDFASTINLDTVQGTITLTGDPFVNAAGNDFSPNSTAGAGALLRAMGFIGAFPGISTTTYQDVGAVQHQDSGGGGGGGKIWEISNA